MKKFTVFSLILGIVLAACAPALPVEGEGSLVQVYALAD